MFTKLKNNLKKRKGKESKKNDVSSITFLFNSIKTISAKYFFVVCKIYFKKKKKKKKKWKKIK